MTGMNTTSQVFKAISAAQVSIEELKPNEELKVNEGFKTNEELNSNEEFRHISAPVQGSILSDIDRLIATNQDALKGNSLIPDKFRTSVLDEKVDAFNNVSADMPDDSVANDAINQEIAFNKELAKKSRPDVMFAFMYALRLLKPKTENIAETGLRKLHNNNTDATKFVNILNQASLRLAVSDANLELMLSDKELTHLSPEDVAKAAVTDDALAKAISMSENARKDLYNKLANPVNSSLIKKLQEDPYIGANARAKLESSLSNAVETMEKETLSKSLLEGMSEQMSDITESLQKIAESLLSAFSFGKKM
jgi:hypothetical protein